MCHIATHGQTVVASGTLDYEFERHVKTVEEFIARFNGDESHPDIPDPADRAENIKALFDYEFDTGAKTPEQFCILVDDFVDSIIGWNGRLSIHDANTWAEFNCMMRYNNHGIPVTFILKQEKNDMGQYRWGVAGAKFNPASAPYDDRLVTISPVDNELNFVGFQDIIESNPKITFTLRSKDKHIDDFSLLCGLIMSGKMTVDSMIGLTYHFTDVPGYVFTIKEVHRQGSNSGWLINSFERMGDFEKLQYINNLFGLQ